MSEKCLDALAACGRERVMERRGSEPAVAIRWASDSPGIPRGEKWVYSDGGTFDGAGFSAASKFATELEERAKRLNEWAKRIRSAIDRG